jgi:molybdopterin molybdotransferase
MADELISVPEAKKIVLECVSVLSPVPYSLMEAAGLTLAENIYAPVSIPNFAQSSMDGYALLFDDLQKNESLLLKGEMAAGSKQQLMLAPQAVARVFTGAPLPTGADTVVMQEKVTVRDGRLYVNDARLEKGMNVRLPGSEISQGELAATKDSSLSASAIGFLAGMGITGVSVYPRPAITIIVTGNELVAPGTPLSMGQVYESNSYSLRAALKQMQIHQVQVAQVEDNLQALMNRLQLALQESDVVFLTGGVSVGEYDFVAAAARNSGVETIFHKIRQRPGKPLFFGRKECKLVFGLPGNPASVMTCFYEYVEPALRKMCKQKTGIQEIKVPLSASFNKPAGLTHFLKGWYDGEKVKPLNAQESFRLSSFARANCLIRFDEAMTQYNEGEMVEIHLLPS